MADDKIASIKELLADHLEKALSGEEVRVSDSVLRSAATFLRLYDPQNKPRREPLRQPEEDTVKEVGEELGITTATAPSVPFSSIDQEVEL